MRAAATHAHGGARARDFQPTSIPPLLSQAPQARQSFGLTRGSGAQAQQGSPAGGACPAPCQGATPRGCRRWAGAGAGV